MKYNGRMVIQIILVGLLAITLAGCDNWLESSPTEPNKPTAAFSCNMQGFTLECSNESLNYDSLQWTWGDATPPTTNIEKPVHVYTRNGDYTVRLTACKGQDFTDTDRCARAEGIFSTEQ